MSREYPATEEQVAYCRQFIRTNCGKTKTIKRKHSSYSYKHHVERWAGEYIPNEAFIEAALQLGFKAVPCCTGSPNRFFNMVEFNHDEAR